MGILPLQFIGDMNRKNLNLVGSELFTVKDIEKGVNPRQKIKVEIKYANGSSKMIETLCRIDTDNEILYYINGGILQYVLRNML
jgi:aconitate hydratase